MEASRVRRLSLDKCTESELVQLQKFRERVADLKQDEMTCLRYLVARNFNLDLAEDMLRKSQSWRKSIGIENYLSWVVDCEPEKFEFSVCGTNYSGGPIVWIPLGSWPARYWIEKGYGDQIQNLGYRILETALVEMQERGHKQASIVMGVETLTLYKVSHIPTLRALYNGFQALEQNYPEILENLTIINAPWMFSIAYNFVRPILSERTLAKVKIFGTNREQWFQVLKEIMPESSIPKRYLEG